MREKTKLKLLILIIDASWKNDSPLERNEIIPNKKRGMKNLFKGESKPLIFNSHDILKKTMGFIFWLLIYFFIRNMYECFMFFVIFYIQLISSNNDQISMCSDNVFIKLMYGLMLCVWKTFFNIANQRNRNNHCSNLIVILIPA